MAKQRSIRSNQQGVILASLLVLMVAFMIIGGALTTMVMSQHTLTSNNVAHASAVLVAEAGVEQSLQELNQDSDFSGFGIEEEFFNTPSQGRGTFQTSVSDAPDGEAKIITSTARVYRYNQNTNPRSTRSVRVTTVGTGSPGYSVHTGPGGLILTGSANITNSDVYVNGYIRLEGASKIGTHINPVEVKVANQRCPNVASPGPTYPQVCASGNEPIALAHSTNIFGTVCATGQTSKGPNNNIQTGSDGLGLIIGCIAPPVAPPTYNRTAHIAAMTTTGAGNSNTYVCSNWPFERTWPGNLRLTGNVSIGGSCDIVIRGDVYITGNLDIGGAARITVDASVGTDRPVIVVDGTITTGGSAQIIANSHGTGIHFISFRTNASCNPGCTALSGNDLKNSQDLQTVTVGGAVNLPGMVFQSYWGKIRLGGSGNLGAAIGQTVDLSGAGTVTFGTTLSSGESTWTVSSYQQVFDN